WIRSQHQPGTGCRRARPGGAVREPRHGRVGAGRRRVGRVRQQPVRRDQDADRCAGQAHHGPGGEMSESKIPAGVASAVPGGIDWGKWPGAADEYNSGGPFPPGFGFRAMRAKVPATSSNERSEEHTSELQSRENLVCRLLLEKKKKTKTTH